jgi:hypothetical protein
MVYFWRSFHGLLRRMCIVLLQDGILYIYLSVPLDLWCHSILEFVFWFFCLDDLSLGDRGVLQSPTTTVLGPISVFKYSSICLMKLRIPTLGAYELIVISSWCVISFIRMKWCLFLQINLDFFLYSFIHMCTHCLGHFFPLPSHPFLLPPTSLNSRQNLFCPFLQFCWWLDMSNNKEDKVFASWDKDSYTERFLALLLCTIVLQSELLIHIYLIYSLLPSLTFP